jgi:catecholate siderophore receptor
MKARGKHHRNPPRRSGKPPRWLVLGALASTAMSGRFASKAYAQDDRATMYRESIAQVLPAPRFDLSPDAAPGTSLAARRFDIPPGPLSEALAAFEDAAGVTVEVSSEAIQGLRSPGVSGLFTVDRALQELLAGTGLTFRFTASRTVAIELPTVSETLDVTERVAPSSPKYTEPLRDTPQTLTVIPQALIEERGATTLRDVLRNVTGISIQAGEGGGGLPGDNLAIRGFTARNDIFIDGVRDFGAYSRDPFNIEQVEVTKGPASLYAGRGSTGGSLNLSSKAPRLEVEHSATFAAGTDHYGRATIDINQPVENFGVAGTALRINAMWTEADTPGRDEVENQRWGIAPSLAFGLGTPTRVTLSYSYLDQDNQPDYGVPWVPATNIPLARFADQPAPVDFDNYYGLTTRDYEKTSTGISTAEVVHDFNDALTLRSVARHGRATRDSIISSPRFVSDSGTAINHQLQSRDLTDTILAQQNDLSFRLETGAVAHDLTAGTEISRETSENRLRTGPVATPTDLFNPDPNVPYAGPITHTGARTESTAKTAALYASDTVKLNEQWQVIGGLRWDRFDIDFDSVAVGGAVTPFERTDEMLSYRAGVVYKPRVNGSFYLSAGTSFNPSSEGNTGLSLAAATVDLEPEKSRGYEAGTKWDLFDNRLAVSTAVFRTEKTNARTPGVNPGDPPTVLQGEQRVDGVELGVSGSIAPRWYAFLGYTYLSSEILESNTPAEVGKEFSNTPDHSLSLWTSYRLRQGLDLGAGAQYVGDRWTNNTNTRLAPDYLLFDAMAAYTVNQRFTLRLNVYNLADERYIDRVGGGHFIPGAGRSASLTTSVNF